MNLVAEEVADSDLSDADLSDMEGPTAVVGMTRRKSAKRAKMRNSSGSMCVKQTLVLVATIGIIIGGSFGIGFIVVQNKNSLSDLSTRPDTRFIDFGSYRLRRSNTLHWMLALLVSPEERILLP